jgi:hypothetical protein
LASVIVITSELSGAGRVVVVATVSAFALALALSLWLQPTPTAAITAMLKPINILLLIVAASYPDLVEELYWQAFYGLASVPET